jgi:FkbM family methyltransferase
MPGTEPRGAAFAAEFDDTDLLAVRHLVGAGDAVIDVGAGEGLVTSYLAERVGPRGRVYSIEPVPASFAVLADNVRRTGLGNVQPLHYAVSDGQSSVVVPAPDGDASLGRHAVIECRTLDALFAHAPRPIRLVRCAAGWCALGCLRGAAGLIERCRPAWWLAVSGDPDRGLSPAAEVMHRMHQAGYCAYWFDGARLQPRGTGERRPDYLFLTPAQREQVSAGLRAES